MSKEKLDVDAFARRMAQALPQHAVDCVILGYDQGQLQALLLKWKYEDVWSLPGGYIDAMENMDHAAYRILEERTGLSSVFLEQFHTFGDVDRSASHYQQDHQKLVRIMQRISPKDQEWDIDWFTKRFLATGYMALVDWRKTWPSPDLFSERCEWVPVQRVPRLMLDHNKILDKALQHLRRQAQYLPIGRSLLPDRFTMMDLQQLYETVLGESLVRSNFQRKVLKLGIVNRHQKLMTGAANKAPYLYSFNAERYEELLREGLGF